MCEARAAWHEAIGTRPTQETAIELVSYLLNKQLRDRIMADTINTAEDQGTYRAVFIGMDSGRPDWSRVDATEALLIDLLAFTPGEDRAALFSYLGWLAWYKGQVSAAAAYFAKALDSEPAYRLAELLDEMLSSGLIAQTATDPETAYRAGFGS